MAVRLDTDLRNGLANVIGEGFNSGTFEVRTGGQPASANDAATGTLLATIILPATPFTTSVSGAVSKTGTWSVTAIASGLAGWGRLIGGTNAMDVSVGTVGTDFIIDDPDVVAGGTVTVTSGSITVPSGE